MIVFCLWSALFSENLGWFGFLSCSVRKCGKNTSAVPFWPPRHSRDSCHRSSEPSISGMDARDWEEMPRFVIIIWLEEQMDCAILLWSWAHSRQSRHTHEIHELGRVIKTINERQETYLQGTEMGGKSGFHRGFFSVDRSNAVHRLAPRAPWRILEQRTHGLAECYSFCCAEDLGTLHCISFSVGLFAGSWRVEFLAEHVWIENLQLCWLFSSQSAEVVCGWRR